MTRMNTLYIRPVLFSLALTLFGCSSSGTGSDDDDDTGAFLPPDNTGSQVEPNEVNSDEPNTSGSMDSDNITSETNSSNIESTTYTTSLVQLNYPSDWIVDTSNPDIEAGFLSNEANSQGGRNNCILASVFDSNSSLLQITEEFIDVFDPTPEPQVSFVTVNGTSMSRVSGRVERVSVDGAAQLAAEDGYVHVLFCLGLTPEELALFFDSMEIL